jgi:hypothetical protein
MSSDSTKPIIFISYAHADEPEKPRGEEIAWLSFVMRFLRPAVKSGAFTMWVDRQMPGGTEWDEEIDRELHACDMFVLLVSASSMGSDYIIDKELEIARARRVAGELYIYPLLIRPTPRAGLDRVREFNLRPRDAKPFSSYSLNDLEQHMSDAADEIADVAEEIAKKRAAAATEQTLIAQLAETAKIVAAIPGNPAAILPNLELEGILPIGRAAAHSPMVAISGLSETGYERLVGRDAELKRLDEAWSDDKTNVLSLVAEGGAGKSALVNEWLTRLQADGFRGAERVLGWSFYSQGSQERATAADAFLDWALDKVGVRVATAIASDKGHAIAKALMARRVLLVLDGVEPLQYGPGSQAGQLKDLGLRALLHRFAAAPPRTDHSLIVLTSRLPIADIQGFRNGPAPVIDVERLSDEAGADLLRDNDVWGIDKELKAASREFAGHPLALTLLASLLKETQNGDVRRRDHIRGLLADADNPRHDQARRVMESYEKEWLGDQPILLAILQCVGLFDRPASGDCLKALRARPPIRGLTDALVSLSDEQWRHAGARLREVQLLAPVDPSDREALDAHPLVREWFGQRLKQTNEAAWKEAHSRLYDHLRDTTRESAEPTLAELAPLYHAMAHGCRAERYDEALHKIFQGRIRRGYRLGTYASDLAAMAAFFDRPYETPVAALTLLDRALVFNISSFSLYALGRLQDALPGMRIALQLAEEDQNWRDAAIGSSNLSEVELLLGNIDAAVATARTGMSHADRSCDEDQMIVTRARYAYALDAAGDHKLAEDEFRAAEQIQRRHRSNSRFLSLLSGYWYCELLLSKGQACEVRGRAKHHIFKLRSDPSTLEIGLFTLMLARAHLALALQGLTGATSAESADHFEGRDPAMIEEAVQHLRSSGAYAQLGRGLLTGAAFRRAIGDWNGAGNDTNEAKEIAESGLMRLYWCDCALERARLALARREAFAPLNALVERSPPPPVLPDPDAAAALKEEARNELDVARKLIAECGYHRRDEELAELDTVVSGARRFADLPPRV